MYAKALAAVEGMGKKRLTCDTLLPACCCGIEEYVLAYVRTNEKKVDTMEIISVQHNVTALLGAFRSRYPLLQGISIVAWLISRSS